MNSSHSTHKVDGTLNGGIGVIGGMGPAATELFFEKILQTAGGKDDQSHPRVVIDNNTNIPDRTKYIVGDGPTPGPVLEAISQELESTGVDVLTMPCNTAHYFIDDLRAAVSIPFLDMIELTTEDAVSNLNNGRVGLLATTGTIQSGLYQDRMSKKDTELVLPSNPIQKELIMPAIYGKEGVKAGAREYPQKKLLAAIEEFNDVDAVITGCTEIELVLSDDIVDVRLINPMDLLSKAAISTAGYGGGS